MEGGHGFIQFDITTRRSYITRVVLTIVRGYKENHPAKGEVRAILGYCRYSSTLPMMKTQIGVRNYVISFVIGGINCNRFLEGSVTRQYSGGWVQA